jgi:thioredoxin 1
MSKLKTSLILVLVWLFLVNAASANPVPKLVDVGADKCIPCIKMAPILEALKADFAGQLEVQFIDAWKNRAEAEGFGVRMIPTQIFFAPDGKELYRHTGFFARADILNKWQELGYRLTEPRE